MKPPPPAYLSAAEVRRRDARRRQWQLFVLLAVIASANLLVFGALWILNHWWPR